MTEAELKTESRSLPAMLWETLTTPPWRNRLLTLFAVAMSLSIMVNVLIAVDQYWRPLWLVKSDEVSLSGRVLVLDTVLEALFLWAALSLRGED